jgi:dihydropyrimidine dehydrogenase (NAD+) subunit PreT
MTASPTCPTDAARAPGLLAQRLGADDYARRFADAHPALTPAQALVEAERCYHCHDAPCIAACPTGIDIPQFIARIAQGNLRGAAKTILEANPLGGMCARVCPTEVLCEDACVRHTAEDKPVEIGRLQRRATDALMARPGAPLFSRAAASGKRVAVVGAGPAGLACAHGLARRGHDVVIFEARDKGGGLNEYGIASYKTTGDFAQKELAWLLSIGGIELRCGHELGEDITLDGLRADFDAVFLGLGLAGVNALGIAEPDVPGLRAAVGFIAELRQARDVSQLAVGRDVVVIGGGMTAIDAAVQCKLLGATTATIVYRRGPASMSASQHEQDWAQHNGVTIRHWAAPQAVLTEEGRLTGMRFADTTLKERKLVLAGSTFTLPADMVLRAIGQTFVADATADVALEHKRIRTDREGRTSVPGVWAGGDCCAGGRDLTVEAVEDGKVAARSIDAALMQK